MYTICCELCKKTYTSTFKTKVCNECKNRPCEICGRNFEHVWPYDQHCCSSECRKLWINRPEHKQASNTRRKETVRSKYGVDNVSELSDVQHKISASKKDPNGYNLLKEQQLKMRPVSSIIRKCIICGQDFQAKGSQTTCSRLHTRKCAVCGSEFEIKRYSDKRQTCSRKCWSMLRKQNILNSIKICKYCGKEFHSTSNTAKYCAGPHFANCIICRKPFILDFNSGYNIDSMPKTCSNVCSAKLAQETNCRLYGETSPHKLPEARLKFKEMSLANNDKRIQTNLAKYGVENVCKLESVRMQISNTIKSEENQLKMQTTMQERYGVNYAMQSSELASKQRRSASHSLACDGTPLDSSWEGLFYDFLVRNNIEFEYNTVTLPYEYAGKNHILHVDFKVGDLLFEVKGDHLLNGQGVGLPIEIKIDMYKKHHVIILCSSNVNGMFREHPLDAADTLVGVDISLFNKSCSIPRNCADLHPCSISSFHDEHTRWKTILECISNYGGFIDTDKILSVLNSRYAVK